MTLIASNVLRSPAATVTFSAIPGTYNDLAVRMVARCAGSVVLDNIYFQFNGETGAHYSQQYMSANQSTQADGQNLPQSKVGFVAVSGANSLANMPSVCLVEIPGYAGTTFYKVATSIKNRSEANGTSGMFASSISVVWANTSAITSIPVATGGGSNLVTGSQFYLYGY